MSIKVFEDHVDRLFVKPADQMGKLLHASMGLSGEAGELIDSLKKSWIYEKPLDLENILEESGDALFYIVAGLHAAGFSLEDAFLHNIDKLKKRYPTGYTNEAAIERLDKRQE